MVNLNEMYGTYILLYRQYTYLEDNYVYFWRKQAKQSDESAQGNRNTKGGYLNLQKKKKEISL